MSGENSLSFQLGSSPNGATTLMPCIDGVPLADLVSAFESSNEYEPAGGYGGLVPKYFKYGSLEDYFLGQSPDIYWQEIGGIYLLGCRCGEVGCWPLIATVQPMEHRLRWHSFLQPHRPDRNYANFGPFEFAKEQYFYAVRAMIGAVGPL